MGKINKLKRFICVLMAALVLMSNVTGTALRTVYAAELGVLFSQMALDSIMTNLLISTGVNYLGYDSTASFKAVNGEGAYAGLVNHLKNKNLAVNNPGLAIIQHAFESLSTAKELYADAYVNGAFSYTCEYGYSLVGNDNGGISIKLNSELIKACRDAVKLWADSAENEFTGVYRDLDLVRNYSENNSRDLVYEAYSLSSFSSISLIDSFYAVDGVVDFIKSKGFDDSNASVLCCKAVSSYFSFLIVPFEYSYINKYLVSNKGFNDLVNSFGNAMSNSDAYDYISRSSLDVSDYCFKYIFKTGVIESASYLSYGVSNFDYWVSFNHEVGIENGSFYRSFSINDDEIIIDDATFIATDKALKYDESKAKSIPDEVTYNIPQDVAVNGINTTDLDTLMKMVLSLSSQLENQTENQEEIIQQNKNILEAINAIHTTIHTSSSNVGKIAATVIALPDLFKELFSTFPSATMINELITGLPALIAEEIYSVSIYPAAERMEALVGTIPAAIAKELVTVFPKADEIADAVIALPGSIGKTLEGISITVPEIKIPSITIPDIKIPEIVIPKIEAPSVTVNPAITIENDYAGLADAIGLQVEGVLTKVFVPSEALTLEKVAHINSYFAFVGQIRDTIDVLVNKLLGITPVPYLKIPLGKETSEYDYGFGEYFIIDCSWYADYKSFGDKIILAICWATFLWKIFMKLPGIISGTEGSIGEADHSYKKYIDKKNSGKKGD